MAFGFIFAILESLVELDESLKSRLPSPAGEGGDSLDKGNVACDKRFAPCQGTLYGG